MSYALRSCWGKINRAYEHVEALQAEIRASAEQGESVRFGSKFDPQTQTVSVQIVELPEIRDRWMLIAADALQNLRAALNHLAWELAVLELRRCGETREPMGNTEFPIATESGRFRGGKIADLHSLHRTMIQGFQPYHRGNWNTPEAHPLALLQRLSNHDKHRTLQLGFINPVYSFVGRYTTQDCIVTHSEYFARKPLKVDAEYARHDVIPTGPNPEVKEQPDLGLAVAFTDGRAVVPTLTKIGFQVDEIVRTFELFFHEPISHTPIPTGYRRRGDKNGL